MKKVLSVILGIALLSAVFTVIPLSAVAKTCGDYDYSIVDETYYYHNGEVAHIERYNGTATNIKIPSKLDGYKVTSVDLTNRNITSIVFPDTVRAVYLDECYSLESVTLPDSATSVSLIWCRPIESIVLPKLTTHCRFYGCENLKSITIPKTVKILDKSDIGICHSSLTVYGYKGTEAERFAKWNNVPFKDATKLNTPKITGFVNTASGVKMTIGAVGGAAKYRVFYKNNGKWKKLGDTATTSFVHKGAESGKKYTYTVRCVDVDGKEFTSGYNTTGWTTTFIATPAAPVLKNTKNGVQVAWKRVAGAAKYRIFRKTGNGNWQKLVDTNNAYVDKSAKKGVTYSYTIRCISADGKKYTSAYNTKGSTIKCVR